MLPVESELESAGSNNNKKEPARQFQKGWSDPGAGQRRAVALFLLGPLSGCGFCGLRVHVSLRLPQHRLSREDPELPLAIPQQPSSWEDRGRER